MAEEIKEKYSNIKTLEIANDGDLEDTKNILREFIGF